MLLKTRWIPQPDGGPEPSGLDLEAGVKAQGILCSDLMIMRMKAGVMVKILNNGQHLGTVQSDVRAGLEVHLLQDWRGPRLPAKVGGTGGVGVQLFTNHCKT